jgi:hypothetical protein
MGRDSATFRENGTEVPSLSRDKGTTGQAQNLATGWDGTNFFTGCPVLSRDIPRHNNFQFCTLHSVLERTFPVLDRPFLF